MLSELLKSASFFLLHTSSSVAASALYWPDGLFPYGFQPSPDACTVVNALDKNRGNVEKGKSRRPTVQEDGLQRRSQVHKVVWGCKHPRLEAAFPQSFQSDVYCHRPPLAPQRRKGTVHVLSPCILCKMRVQICMSEGPAVHVHNLWQASRGGKGGRGVEFILTISCSGSVHVNILHSAVIAGSRG